MNLARSTRLVRWGVTLALLTAVGGWALERARFGATDRDSVGRVETEIRQLIGRSADTLGTLAARVATERAAIAQASRDQSAAKRLFGVVNAAVSSDGAERTGISVYDSTAEPLAWAGLVSELPRDRIVGSAALFIAPGTFGPRLIRVQPVSDGTQPSGSRTGTIVAEQSLGVADAIQASADTFTLSTSIVPVALRTASGTAPRNLYTFSIPSGSGEPLIDAEVSPALLQDAHAVWRHARWAAVVSILALTILMLAAPLLDLRRRTHERRVFVLATGALVLTLLVCRVCVWFAVGLVSADQSLTSPVDLLLSALTLVAIVWLVFDSIEGRRLARPHPRLASAGENSLHLAAMYAGAGVVDIVWLWAYERILQSLVGHSTLDLLHFSLHPLGPSRLAIAFSLVLLHAAAIWIAAAILRVPSLVWRTPRSLAATAALSWLAGGVLGGVFVAAGGGAAPLVPMLVALLGAGACVAATVGLRARARHASQAARVAVLFLALLVPAVVMYPSLLSFATAAKEQLIANQFGPEAASERDALKERLLLALEQIDSMPSLAELLVGSSDTDIDTPSTDRAFRVWQNTDLATYRLKSAIELYGARGALVSRFALRLPDYTNATHTAAGCRWDIIEEPSPFGTDARHVFRASRGICSGNHSLGAIVVRVLFDYQTLPFIGSPNPYPESLRSDREESVEGASARDVEFVVYGWSRAPLSASGTSVWTVPDDVFKQLTASRDPFWTTIPREDELFRVYFMSDRVGIYALGYPVISRFGHLINLAELVTLVGALYVLLLAGATLFNTLTSATPASGRALLREIRSSFYQKLFLAYVAGAIVPVVILAVATQRYVASQLRAGVEDAAAMTATVAQRLVEDYATLQQRRSTGTLQSLDDQAMGLVGRAIDQDVNLFDGTRLQATSERDLFASKLLPTRTPGDVYERIVLDRLPTYVGVESVGFLLAAAPVRAGGHDGIVTVPLTLRQQEIERQIDELNRRVLFGAVLFSLLGAALGYWMAERVADPVNRLTRATRRIARGDLDARIAATSSDELRRLVEDFNRMAADLKRQRGELERTQRLEAWADMARQVAHDIKNPLTPIQLSAEHAQRVNADRGRPLSPVLDECVAAILSQVKLLRQISAEFSSFASSPTPRPEPSSVAELLEEVVEPYRTGLSGRVAITVDASRDLPLVRIDRTLFARALTNVIENAIHAMPAGGTLTISSRREPPDSRLLTVQVADSGMGMDEVAQRKIFEPYFSTKATGTGLGLTIAKRNVELNGGTIAVKSERGVGTTVTMTLPIA